MNFCENNTQLYSIINKRDNVNKGVYIHKTIKGNKTYLEAIRAGHATQKNTKTINKDYNDNFKIKDMTKTYITLTSNYLFEFIFK